MLISPPKKSVTESMVRTPLNLRNCVGFRVPRLDVRGSQIRIANHIRYQKSSPRFGDTRDEWEDFRGWNCQDPCWSLQVHCMRSQHRIYTGFHLEDDISNGREEQVTANKDVSGLDEPPGHARGLADEFRGGSSDKDYCPDRVLVGTKLSRGSGFSV